MFKERYNSYIKVECYINIIKKIIIQLLRYRNNKNELIYIKNWKKFPKIVLYINMYYLLTLKYIILTFNQEGCLELLIM